MLIKRRKNRQLLNFFKGNYYYLLRTVKNRYTETAAAPTISTGSKIVENKGSAGISPFVKGNDASSRLTILPY